MFTPTAKVIADSISPAGVRLTTFEVRMHRFVLAEFNTHRALSRNSASSRAIPVRKTFQIVADEPAIPLSWPAERKGMQGGEELPKLKQVDAVREWLSARDEAVAHAERLVALGVHKSVVNRLLEPFMPHTVIVSATDWNGFFAQRCSPLAQPEIKAVADAMRVLYETHQPNLLRPGQWHLPYITADEWSEVRTGALYEHALPRISAARCARVSYLTHDGRRDTKADVDLYNRLIEADPPHASPLEHVATPLGHYDDHIPQQGNFTGWRQLRHVVLQGR